MCGEVLGDVVVGDVDGEVAFLVPVADVDPYPCDGDDSVGICFRCWADIPVVIAT